MSSIDITRQHVRDALRLLADYDRHHDDCICAFCLALGELEAARNELSSLRRAEAAH